MGIILDLTKSMDITKLSVGKFVRMRAIGRGAVESFEQTEGKVIKIYKKANIHYIDVQNPNSTIVAFAIGPNYWGFEIISREWDL